MTAPAEGVGMAEGAHATRARPPGPLRVPELLGIDPITFEVLGNAFSSIVDEMGALLQKCAFSIVVADGRDYSGTICDGEGNLVASGSTDLPAHLGTIPFTVKGTLEWAHAPKEEYFRPGDIVVINDAYIGGTHNNDVRLIMPVFAGDRIVAFVQNSAHWTDIGGHVPGTFDPNARSSHGEGLIIPPIHLVREGVLDRDLVRVILRNVRTPEVAYGDLMAQIGTVRLGNQRLLELIAQYGVDLVEREMEGLMAYSEALLREEFRRLPDGDYEFVALIDRDPGADADDPVAVRMTLRIDGDRAAYDFSKSDGEARGAINGPRSATVSAAVVTTKGIFPWIPMNQGVFQAVDFVLPDGLVCSARYPAPISGMAAAIFPAVTDCVLGTFIQIIPDRCMAGPAGLVNTVSGGHDPRPGFDREFVTYIWLEGGWGGRPAKRDNFTSMCLFATSGTNQPVEQQERLFPMIFDAYRFEIDSFGAGLHRGGPGVTKVWHFTHGDAVFSSLGDGERFGPWGHGGGKDAPGAKIVYAPGTDEEASLGMFCTGFTVRRGRQVLFFHSGGGGWGDPLARPPEWVLEDVADELLSIEAAARDFGVVVRRAKTPWRYTVDVEATEALRRARGGS
jgi:N-methylhydantoinase B